MDTKKIVESLSSNEVKIIPFLKEGTLSAISGISGLDSVSAQRALDSLSIKGVVELSKKTSGIVDIDVNGAFYLKNGLPERRLMNSLKDKRVLSMKDAKKLASLSDEEMKASIGILRKKSIIELKNGNIHLDSNGNMISKKTDEEIFLESLPLICDNLSKQQKSTLDSLLKRKSIVRISEEKGVSVKVTKLGDEIMSMKIKNNLIEQITPEILAKESLWKDRKFRRYDISAGVPEIFGGKRHFVNLASDYARRIWSEMGFKEMEGSMVVDSFWNFDALFTPQDHPVREMQDTFFVSNVEGEIDSPDKKLVNSVKESHEGKLKGLKSKGWNYSWKRDEAGKAVLRTHTTVLSAKTLFEMKKKGLKFPQKFFALGKCFRNETVDWSHGFEFNQTEGIVVDKNANFRHLLGYLKQFFKKMGFEEIRFRPAYFPYTEPSVEIDVYHKGRKKWIELGGAGIFRPEVVVPLLGENIPVLAWGPGFDRMITDYYGINDLRELYKNNVEMLRKIKPWMKT